VKITEITDNDAKFLLQIKNILKRTVVELKFSLGDAMTVNESIKWFDGFMQALANVQKMEHEAKKKSETVKTNTEGLGSLKIKDINLGTFPTKKTSKPKSKVKSKGRK